MTLEGNCSGAEVDARFAISIIVSGIGEVHDCFVVDFDGDVVALDDDVFGEPGVVLNELFEDVLLVPKAAGLAGIFVEGVVDLDLVPLCGPTGFLVGRVEKDTAIRAGFG